MSSLNTSTNGQSISKSYQSVVNAPAPSGSAAKSPTYGQWAIFSVSAPLASAFQDSGSKESVLKVQSTGEGELVDLIDEFSDGRIQFAYVKVRDSNSGLPKNALIAWCGEGVPERTKGYFTSHVTAVSKVLHGYHVQITARSDRDLTPESIIQKVADASGSKYSASSAGPAPVAATKPITASKPVFSPTQNFGGSGSFNPLASRTSRQKDTNVDQDGWGTDAPELTRTQLEKVQPAYQPTKVNMRELTSQPSAQSSFRSEVKPSAGASGVTGGSYQPVGKVDIAEIRRKAQASGNVRDDRPEIVKGAYEPIGKVDIAAIRAKAQKPEDAAPGLVRSSLTGQSQEAEDSIQTMSQRPAAFSAGSERLTSMPKPKVANKFGGGSTFTGTRAPAPGGFEAKPSSAAVPVGLASRTFADQGGKTPAQIWAEKKARERGSSGSGTALPPSGYTGQLPIAGQKSGGKEWESAYSGKKWAPVSTSYTGQSRGSNVSEQRTGELPPSVHEQDEDESEIPTSPSGGIGSIRDRFSGTAPMGAPQPTSYDRVAPPPAPAPETSTKPNRGVPMPGLPTRPQANVAPSLPSPPAQPRSPTPPTPEARDVSPIRVAMPISSKAAVTDLHEQQTTPPPTLPTQSISRAIPVPRPEDDEPETGPDPARKAAQSAAVDSVGPAATATAPDGGSGARAKAEYDYDAAEDNEVSLQEGEIVTDVQQIDPDWWVVTNSKGQQGLVPSNYLSMLEDDEPAPVAAAYTPPQEKAAPTVSRPVPAASRGPTAIAQYDYEAAEDNELSFPEDAQIINIEFPDDDWWHGEYQGKSGLFPSSYVMLEQ